jgi:hypothetical protein
MGDSAASQSVSSGFWIYSDTKKNSDDLERTVNIVSAPFDRQRAATVTRQSFIIHTGVCSRDGDQKPSNKEKKLESATIC